MKNKIIILFVFLVICAGVVYYVYTTSDKPITDEDKISISILTLFENKPIETNVLIETNQGIIELNTSKTYELIKVFPNQTIKITNKNIIKQKFYSDTKEIKIENINERVELTLDEPKELEVKVSESDNINVFLFSENFKEVRFCLTWSLNYIFVKALNYTEIQRLEGYEDYERCYQGNFSLINSNKTIEVKYQNMGIPDEKDYIKMIILDKANNGKIINIK